MSIRHTTTAATWITEHLQTDARKFGESAIEFAGLLFEVRHDSERRTYAWLLDGREVSRETVETAIDRRLND